jgi:hypothetical protein
MLFLGLNDSVGKLASFRNLKSGPRFIAAAKIAVDIKLKQRLVPRNVIDIPSKVYDQNINELLRLK